MPVVQRGYQLHDAPVPRRSPTVASSARDGALPVPPPRSHAGSQARPPRRTPPASHTPQSRSAGQRSRATTTPAPGSALPSRTATVSRQAPSRTATLPRQPTEYATTTRTHTHTRPSRTASVDRTVHQPMSHRQAPTVRTRSVSHGGPVRSHYTYVANYCFISLSMLTHDHCSRPHKQEVLQAVCALPGLFTHARMVNESRSVLFWPGAC